MYSLPDCLFYIFLSAQNASTSISNKLAYCIHSYDTSVCQDGIIVSL
jgi:hypothetical protein